MTDVISTLRDLLGHDHVATDIATRRAANRGTWPLEVKWERLGLLDDVPLAVAIPLDTAQVAGVLQIAADADLPVVPVGGASGIVGGLRSGSNTIALSLRRLQHRELDPISMTVRVGAGVILSDLEEWLSQRGFTTGHFPQSFHLATVGGMVATNGTGTFSTKYGRMRDIVQSLEIVIADGRVIRTPSAPDASIGPNLNHLFVGSEGTFGIITEADLQVWPRPETRIVNSYAVPTVEDGMDALRTCVGQGLYPALVRLYDTAEAQHLWEGSGIDQQGPLLILGHEGRQDLTTLELDICQSISEKHGATFVGDAPGKHWLAHRYDWLRIPATNERPGGIADAIEVSAPWAQLPDVWRTMRTAIAPLCETVESHLSHIYHVGGSVYVLFYAQAEDDQAAVALYGQILDRLLTTSVDAGGSVSHHHGIGTAKIPWLRRQLGDGYDVLKSVKGALDPDSRLVPGVLGLGE